MAYGVSLEMLAIRGQGLNPICLHPVGYANRHERRKAAAMAGHTRRAITGLARGKFH
jgi:hypothetical protein